jgi:D-glycero-alpha-D-manno-heptose-7-phosphate kinase
VLIIASAPLRISLLGGGTDMVEYFGTKDHIGACLSMSINRGIYCIIQDADALYIDEEAASPLTDAVIELFRIVYGEVPKVRISFREDIPTRGTGLGSSSAWCGALTRALKQYAVSYMKKWTPKYEKFCPTIVTSADLSLMAEHTYMMERIAGMYCGKQDHYSAVNRGVNLYSFFHDTVMTQRQDVDASMIDRMVLFNIGGNRNSETILKEQAGNIKSQLDELDAMASLARLGAVH